MSFTNKDYSLKMYIESTNIYIILRLNEVEWSQNKGEQKKLMEIKDKKKKNKPVVVFQLRHLSLVRDLDEEFYFNLLVRCLCKYSCITMTTQF